MNNISRNRLVWISFATQYVKEVWEPTCTDPLLHRSILSVQQLPREELERIVVREARLQDLWYSRTKVGILVTSEI